MPRPEIVNVKLSSALHDAVNAMVKGTGLRTRDKGDTVELIDPYDEVFGEVGYGDVQDGEQRFVYKSNRMGDTVTAGLETVSEHIKDDMSGSWSYEQLPPGAFQESVMQVDLKLRKVLTEAFFMCHGKMA